jgi:hypothetical protein
MNEKRKPRISARRASPTFMLNCVARIAQHMTVDKKSPMDHQANGMRSATGVYDKPISILVVRL